jgi:glycosyltransferase involved in cell wall biosynthesis
MSQKKVLLITYYFPPLGGAGIARPLALFQNLPLHKYECHILTVKSVLYRAYEPELLQELDSSKIFRSGSRDPSRLLYLLGMRHISAKAAESSRDLSRKFFPDAKAGWIKPAIRMGEKLVKSNNYDLIMSTSPPISAHVIAQELAQVSGIPWVADFRDFWTSYKAEDYFDSDSKKNKAKELLDEIKSFANSIVAVNESVARYVGAKSVVTNCYDSNLAKQWKKPQLKHRFTIGVFGTISDLTPIEPLLMVLQTVKKSRPEIYSHIRVFQVGQVDSKWLKQKVKDFGLKDIFDIREFQTRAKAIELLSEAALFYVGVSPEQGFGLTTNRIFTLLSSGRPILAYTVSGSEFDRIISHSVNSFRFDDSNTAEAGRYLSQTAQKYFNGDLSIDVEPASVREFSSDRMVEKFVTLFNRAIDE